jgi:glucose/arabinose dehydrogenase
MRTITALGVALALGALTGTAFAQLHTAVVVSGLSQPVAFVQDPAQPAVQFVVQQGGRIRVVQNGVLGNDFLDLTGQVAAGSEQGLLGLAFAPDYATTRRFFVNFTDLNGNTVVARFQRSASDPLRADPSTRFDLGWPGCHRYIAQPYANHNGGNLEFGDDGYLYIGLGDGGSGGDPSNNAQSATTLLGKMLRIDVNVADGDPRGFAVPADNPRPFGADTIAPAVCPGSPSYPQPGLSELMWDIGLRNPWRYSFDLAGRGGTGALYIADVGQVLWEELDYEPARAGGRNYGWRNREGAHDYDQSIPPSLLPLVEPVLEYSHSVGNAITGGYVYRGTALGATYGGRYFFGDFGTGRVWSLRMTTGANGVPFATDVVEHTAELGGAATVGNISSFGLDANRELYIVSYSRGAILRLASSASPPPCPPGGAGDFTCDGKSDLLLQDPQNGAVVLWQMDGPAYASSTLLNAGGTLWQVVGTGDFTGDGRPDIVWQLPSTGAVLLWEMNGTSYVSSIMLNTGGTLWRVAAVGDLTGDGRPDIIWQHPSNGAVLLWQMSGTTYVGSTILNPGGTFWKVVGAADFTGDGLVDLLWQHPFTGAVLLWAMNGTAYVSGTFVNLGGTLWQVAAVADFNGDGHPDIVWQHPSTGAVLLWQMSGVSYVQGSFIDSTGTTWLVRGPR